MKTRPGGRHHYGGARETYLCGVRSSVVIGARDVYSIITKYYTREQHNIQGASRRFTRSQYFLYWKIFPGSIKVIELCSIYMNYEVNKDTTIFIFFSYDCITFISLSSFFEHFYCSFFFINFMVFSNLFRKKHL